MANNPFWKTFTNTLSAYIKPTGWNFSPTMTYILSRVGIKVSQLQDPVAQQEDKRVWKHTPNAQFTVVGTDYQLVLRKEKHRASVRYDGSISGEKPINQRYMESMSSHCDGQHLEVPQLNGV
ncbi:hypothetical protein IFM89_011700 [Coptis chinensis]|uniref:Uncharacterized protein n=1 Tax=Coptis chinensis TaxID=261450 RepID=A0A835GVW1_9MAGN|nr:hypothetical protein IFM89_011700 [Coptis chinensis]